MIVAVLGVDDVFEAAVKLTGSEPDPLAGLLVSHVDELAMDQETFDEKAFTVMEPTEPPAAAKGDESDGGQVTVSGSCTLMLSSAVTT